MRFQLIRTYRGHQETISALAAVPGYAKIVSASSDGLIKIWDLRSDSSSFVRSGGTGYPTAVQVFPGGFFMASGSSDGHLKLWNLETGEIVREMTGHQAAITALEISHNGQRILSGSNDHTLQIWDTLRGRQMHVCDGYPVSVETIAIAPDDDIVLAGGLDSSGESGIMKAWHIETGKPIAHFGSLPTGGHDATILRDGKHMIFVSAYSDVVIWSLQTGKQKSLIEGLAGAPTLAVMPAQKSFVVGTRKPSLALFHLETGEKIYQFDEPSDQVTRIAITTDGRYVVAGCRDGSLNFYMRVL